MNLIQNYIDDSFYTFETGIVGKEFIKANKGQTQILIPAFQVGLVINEENLYFKKQYFIFNSIYSFNARISYFDSDIIDEYVISFDNIYPNNNLKEIELESMALRENTKTFCIYKIQFEQLNVFYDEKVVHYQDVFINTFEKIIEDNNLNDFLNLKEIELNSSTDLNDLLLKI